MLNSSRIQYFPSNEFYRLVSVVVHIGDDSQGHYIVYKQCPYQGSYFYFYFYFHFTFFQKQKRNE